MRGPTPPAGSVSAWIGRLKAGDHPAAQHLWERYFGRLVRLARQKLRGKPLRAADEEDVALSAFDSFCRGAAAGRFPLLHDRDNLWPLLVVLTSRKAVDFVQHEGRQKRGAGAVRGESALDAGRGGGIDQVLAREPSPEFAALLAEEYRRLLDRLPNDTLQSVALWKMEGYTNEEIAAKLGCVPRTVDRKLRLIRSLWDPERAS